MIRTDAEVCEPSRVAPSSTAVRAIRAGARAPIYGPLNTVVSIDVAEGWLRQLLECHQDATAAPLAIMQLARQTGDRFRDVSDTPRAAAAKWLTDVQAPAHLIQLVREGGNLEEEEQGQILGDTQPTGLRIQ